VQVASLWLAWGATSAPEDRLWRTSVDNGVATSGVQVSDAAYWDVCAELSGNAVRGIAYDGSYETWAVVDASSESVGLYRSRDGGTTWPYATAVALAASSRACSITWDSTRARFVYVGSKGDTYTFVGLDTIVSTARQTLAGIGTTAFVRMAAGGGVVVAWASADYSGSALAASLLWRSDDGGETWAAVTLPTAIGATLTDVTYADGVWVATTTAAPYLWRSDDGGETWERVALPLGEESSWALHRAVYADGAVTATGLTWTVATTRAAGLAPDASRVYSPEPGYLADAGYLRGRRIAATAPTAGQGLVWDAGGGVWTPGAAGMANPMTSVGDLIRGGTAGAPTRVAVGTSGQVLTVVGGVPAWAAAAGPSGATIDLSSSAGWTTDVLGSGSAAVDTVDETVDITTGASGIYARAGRAVPWTTLQVSVRARLVSTNADAIGHELGMFFSDTVTGATFVGVVVFGSGVVRAVSSAAFSTAADVTVAGILAGQGWVRVDFYGGGIAVYAGVGTGGAEPTAWTPVGWVEPPVVARVPWQNIRFQINAGAARTASWGSITYYDGAIR
jgi:photosystem II stability/assembly factor-like uncharacterized protein